jgi:hypothetical protein
LDLIYTPEEGQVCFTGTLDECTKFVAEQETYGFKIMPMTEEEFDIKGEVKESDFSNEELHEGIVLRPKYNYIPIKIKSK